MSAIGWVGVFLSNSGFPAWCTSWIPFAFLVIAGYLFFYKKCTFNLEGRGRRPAVAKTHRGGIRLGDYLRRSLSWAYGSTKANNIAPSDYPIMDVLRVMGKAHRVARCRTRTADAGRHVSKLVRTSIGSSSPRVCSSNRRCQRTYSKIISWPRSRRRLLRTSRTLRYVAFRFNFFPGF